MAFFQNLRSFMQLPGSLNRAGQAQSEAERVRQLLIQRQARAQQPVMAPAQKPPVLPQVAPGLTSPPITTPAPQSPQVSEVNPQIAAIQASLGGLKTQAESIQAGLKAQQPTAPVVQPDTLGAIRSKLTSLYAPSPEEEQLRTKLSNLQASRELGLIDIERQPIPLRAMEGEQGRILRQTAVQSGTLSDQLAQAQARRQSAIDVAKTELGFEGKKIEQQKPIEIESGKQIVKFNPQTGKYESVFEAKPKEPSSSEITNYNFARQQQGYKGTFMDFINEKRETQKSVVDPITGEIHYYSSIPGKPGGNIPAPPPPPPPSPQGAAAIPPQLKAAYNEVGGIGFIDMSKITQKQLPYAQRVANESNVPLLAKEDANKIQDAYASFQSARSLIDQIRNLTSNVITAENNRTSMAEQAVRLSIIEKAPFASTDNDAKQFVSARNSVLSLLTRAAGEKGMLTNQDVARIAEALPSYGDNKYLAVQKAFNMENVINSVFKGAIQAYIGTRSSSVAPTGATYTPGTVVEVNGQRYTVGADGDTLMPTQ